MVGKTYFKQRLKYILATSLVAILFAFNALATPTIVAAIAGPTDGGGGGATSTVPPFYAPGKYTVPERAVLMSELFLAFGSQAQGDRCAFKVDGLSEADAGKGNWFTGRYGSLGYHVEPDDGKVGCDNEKGWFSHILNEAGYSGDYLALAQQVYKVAPQGGAYYNGDFNKLKQIIGTALFGAAGLPRETPDYITYNILLNNFMATNACGAKEMTSQNQGAGKEKVDIYVYDSANQRTTVKTFFYESKKANDDIQVGYGLQADGATDGKLECRQIAENLKSSRYAQAAVNYAKDTGDTSASKTTTDGQSAADVNPCGITGALSWIACPLTDGLKTFTDFLSGVIESLLTTPTEQIFDTKTQQSAQSYYSAWSAFRNLGVALIVIVSLIMIISQALHLDIFDAYTIRKVLPRLIIAMIGISISWPVMQIIVTFFNDIGQWAHDLILIPFGNMSADFNAPAAIINYLLVGAGGAAALISIDSLGFAGVLSLLGTLALALLVGLFVLAIRQLIIVVAILMAPLAIAAYILPGTQKLWEFWKNAFLTSLFMFPIIMAFLAAGQAMAFVAMQGGAGQKILALLVYFAPYVMLPFAFKLAGGLMSTIFSIANDRSRGLFDRGKKFRQDTRERRKHELASGLRKSNGLSTGWARRTTLATQGGFSMTKAGRRRYEGALGHLQEQARAEALKRDNGFSSGDTDANALAQDVNMTRERFINNYASSYRARTGASQADSVKAAEESLGRMEASYGAKLGTTAMAQAAFQAYHADNTTYTKKNADGTISTDWDAINRDAKRMMTTAGMSAADVTRVVKSNPTRADRSAVGFGTLMTHFEGVMGNPGGTAVGGGPLLKTNEQLEDAALEGAKPGDILMGHLNTAKTLLGAQTRATQRALRESATATGEAGDAAVDHIIDMFATMASQVDQGGGTSREKASQLADQLTKTVSVNDLHPKLRALLDNIINVKEVVRNEKGKPVIGADGKPQMRVVQTNDILTLKSITDELGTVSERFGSSRRTYNNAAYADAAARAAASAADPGSPGPVPGA